MRMTTTVQKLGNSFAFIVTQEEARILGLSQGDKVAKKIIDKKIVFERVVLKKQPKTYTLDELVKGITKKNRYKEISTGPAVGNEFW